MTPICREGEAETFVSRTPLRFVVHNYCANCREVVKEYKAKSTKCKVQNLGADGSSPSCTLHLSLCTLLLGGGYAALGGGFLIVLHETRGTTARGRKTFPKCRKSPAVEIP